MDYTAYRGKSLDLASLRAFYANGGHPAAVVDEVYESVREQLIDKN